jgi:hypothetical protein
METGPLSPFLDIVYAATPIKEVTFSWEILYQFGTQSATFLFATAKAALKYAKGQSRFFILTALF